MTKLLAKIGGTAAVFLVLFGFGFAWRDVQRGQLPSTDALAALLRTGQTRPNPSPTEVFKAAFDYIRTKYYKKVEPRKLKYAAIAGMVNSLGDPHTQFLDDRITREFALETRGTFAGVGAKLSPDPLGARVVIVFEDGPAAKAGVKREDVITGVDGKNVGGKPIDEIVGMIRGKEGTYVTLQIVRQGEEKPLSIRIRRAQVVTPTVEAKMIEGTRLGYVSVSMFSEPTAEQLERALDKLESEGMRGLIMDLRGNPGGLLESAVDVLSLFLDNKVVVKIKGRNIEEVERTRSGKARPAKYPIVTLIDQDSASAAEIFAGAMRDYRMATLVGEHSYGKASVQSVIPMIDGASVKVTIAKYFLPSGQDISRKVDEDGQYVSGGLEPDVKVEFDWEELAGMGASPLEPGDPKHDNQLRKAIEILKEKLGSASAIAGTPRLASEARSSDGTFAAITHRAAWVVARLR